MNTLHNIQVAEEIKRQIGNRALFMLGAHLFGYTSDVRSNSRGSLMFRIKGSKLCNHIEVSLNGKDLYDITFTNIKHINVSKTFEVKNVIVEKLLDTITEHTELYTSV